MIHIPLTDILEFRMHDSVAAVNQSRSVKWAKHGSSFLLSVKEKEG